MAAGLPTEGFDVRSWMRGLAITVAALMGSMTAIALQAAPASAEARTNEIDFVARINVLRVSKGLVPLTIDAHLTDIARTRSAKMASDGAISHNPNLAAQVGGNGWRTLGENVGVGQTVDWLESAFEASPHHYENLVEPDYRWVGIGIVESGGQIWVTEDFEQPKTVVSAAGTSKPAAAPAPKPVAAPKPAVAKPAVAKPVAAPKPATPPTTAKATPVAAAPTTTAAPPTTTPPPTVMAVKDGPVAAAPLVKASTSHAVTTPLVLLALALLISAGVGIRKHSAKR
jgi:hypothetical protein